MSRIIYQEEALKITARWLTMESRARHLGSAKRTSRFAGSPDLIHQDEAVAFMVELAPHGFLIVPRCTELAPVKFISFSGDYVDVQAHPFIMDIKDKLLVP